jgi:hypothetical protein
VHLGGAHIRSSDHPSILSAVILRRPASMTARRARSSAAGTVNYA